MTKVVEHYVFQEDEIVQAINWLKADIVDDWFPDPKNFKDILNSNFLINKVNTNIEANDGIYIPEQRVMFDVPKGNGTYRYSLEFSAVDRFAYHLFGVGLIARLDQKIPFNVLSTRRSNIEGEYLKPFIGQWQKFINYTKICGKNKFIFETDLTNYFDHINIDTLSDGLNRVIDTSGLDDKEKEYCIFLAKNIISVLEQCSYNGKRGLPQNRDVSSFLANIYMQSVDRLLGKFTFFRYMDDIRVVCDSLNEANRIALLVSRKLRELGLSLNGSKTKILSPDTDEHHKFISDSNLEFDKVQSLMHSGKRKLVLVALKVIQSKVMELLENDQISDRMFRAYIGRLLYYYRAKDISVNKQYTKKLLTTLLTQIEQRADCADQAATILQSVKPDGDLLKPFVNWLVKNEYESFEWSYYCIFKAVILLNEYSKELLEFSKRIIVERPNTPLASLAVIYVAIFEKDHLSLIQDSLSEDNSHFFQRHVLIALSSISPKLIVKSNKHKLIKKCNKGMHQELHRSFHANPKKFQYFEPSRKLTFNQLIKEYKPYA